MKTLTATRPARKPASNTKPVSRKFRWLYRHPGEALKGAVQMMITFANRSELYRYWIASIPSDFGTAHELEKINPDGTSGETYQVLVDSPQDCICSCKGFEAHSHCKHLDLCRVVACSK
jgi:hypothetical protein